MLFPINQVAELICLIFAFIYLRDVRNGFWRYFKWFMLFTLAIEIPGYIFSLIHQPNHWLYNIYFPLEIAFEYYILYKLCSQYFRVKYLIAAFLLVVAGFYIYESTAAHLSEYSFRANSIASVGILLICCCYFYYFLKKEEYVNIYTHPPFWVITGLFFFYIGSTGCNIFYHYLASIYLQQHIPLKFIIFTMLNFILYSCWSYSFVCKYRQIISSS